MLCCCTAGEEEQKGYEVAELQGIPVLDTSEAKLVEQAIKKAAAPEEQKSEPKAPAYGSFSVVVQVKGHSSLGLELDNACELGPMIKEVKSGAIEAFNELHPLTALKDFDIITSIDGSQNFRDIFQKLGDGAIDNLTLKMLRPRKVELSLSKTDSLGLKLDFAASSVGAVVREIAKGGLVATWNAKNSDVAVGENDRVLGVNGTKHLGDELLAAIQDIPKNAEFSLTVLKY
eukprot:Skav214318  [mRNA]  locus=scaffold86:7394:8086:+ [translate_table: standard]